MFKTNRRQAVAPSSPQTNSHVLAQVRPCMVGPRPLPSPLPHCKREVLYVHVCLRGSRRSLAWALWVWVFFHLAEEEDSEFAETQVGLDQPCPLGSHSFPSLWPSPFLPFGARPLPRGPP